MDVVHFSKIFPNNSILFNVYILQCESRLFYKTVHTLIRYWQYLSNFSQYFVCISVLVNRILFVPSGTLVFLFCTFYSSKFER